MRPIVDIAEKMGLRADQIEPYGKYMAKVPFDAFGPYKPHESKLIVVTAMTPTPAGEGKTTTSIGLVQGLAKIGKNPVLTLREPSLGPVFGGKGGGTGGGKARVMPDVDINLHFTGDAHAVASAHNVLAALTDSAIYHKTISGFEESGVVWKRVTNIPDRTLRKSFDLDAASEVMAILALAKDYDDLRARLERIVVGFTTDNKPITASDVGAVGSMMALLQKAVNPNLVQTLEGQPAFVHAGPFGNIAHGCSSIIADQMAMSYGDIVVTEAGFGADLGFEKFMHIKTRASDVMPSAAVVVATVRAMKWHGGTENLQHAIGIVKQFELPAVVAINRFPDDRAHDVKALKQAAQEAGAHAVVESHGYDKGSEGTVELAEAVVAASEQPSKISYLYRTDESIQNKVAALAKNVYLAGDVNWRDEPKKRAQLFTDLGWGNLPICVAKTHMSLSADKDLIGKPEGHTFPIRGIRISAGAGFVYLLAGTMITLPGLQEDANAYGIDIDGDGNIIGVL